MSKNCKGSHKCELVMIEPARVNLHHGEGHACAEIYINMYVTIAGALFLLLHEMLFSEIHTRYAP